MKIGTQQSVKSAANGVMRMMWMMMGCAGGAIIPTKMSGMINIPNKTGELFCDSELIT